MLSYSYSKKQPILWLNHPFKMSPHFYKQKGKNLILFDSSIKSSLEGKKKKKKQKRPLFSTIKSKTYPNLSSLKKWGFWG